MMAETFGQWRQSDDICLRDSVAKRQRQGPLLHGPTRTGRIRVMSEQGTGAIRRIVVVGGGSAGWMAAAALANGLGLGRSGTAPAITLVESDEIGIVGVGEATIPPIRLLNHQLGLDEAEFMAATQGSFKLGIQFVGWGWADNSYFHPFGSYGAEFDAVPVHHWWAKARADGDMTPLDALSLAWGLASRGRFEPPVADPRNIRSTLDYAYHFDAALYGQFLRARSQALGVARVEGRLVAADRDGETGHVTAVRLADGQLIAGDLFIDCSGFRSLLLGEACATPFEDWSHWLPVDRAWAVPTANVEGGFTPYTRSTAHAAGWQWRIPLQHRTGNGHVFSSAFMDEAVARDVLLANLDGVPLAEPRLLQFRTGRRRQSWVGNVVGIGLAAGFLEPLESTSIHLVQSALTRLLALFPDRAFAPHVREEYNRLTAEEWGYIRDFLILHYHLNRREEPLWRHVASYAVPDYLAHRIASFRSHGRLVAPGYELFQNPSWLAVHVGQGNGPHGWDPLADARSFVDYRGRLASLRRVIADVAEAAPTHAQFVAQHCRAPVEPVAA